MKEKRKKIAAIDLDGVLNIYDGNYIKDTIENKHKWTNRYLKICSKIYDIEIFTARNSVEVEQWLKENNLLQYVCRVTNIKNPYTSVFVDDRAISHKGNFLITLWQMIDYQPHWKKRKPFRLIQKIYKFIKLLLTS